ncbi:MAG: hypothetical protein IJR96_00920 [Pseudobutyrivibrio sp.]|nr:hypothetical protein [Pseudobutyrivibrio sp.]
MKFSDSCAKCMYDRQMAKTDNEAYLSEVKPEMVFDDHLRLSVDFNDLIRYNRSNLS